MEPYNNDFAAIIVVPDDAQDEMLSQFSSLVTTILDAFSQVKSNYKRSLDACASPGHEIPGILRVIDTCGPCYDSIFSGGEIDDEPMIEIIKQSDIDINKLIDKSWVAFVFIDALSGDHVCNTINKRMRKWSRVVYFTEHSFIPQGLRENDLRIDIESRHTDELALVVGEVICAFMCFQVASLGLDEFCTHNSCAYDYLIYKETSTAPDRYQRLSDNISDKMRGASDVFVIIRFRPRPENYDMEAFDSILTVVSNALSNNATLCVTDNSMLQMDEKFIVTIIFC